jgi:hypothetical protein
MSENNATITFYAPVYYGPAKPAEERPKLEFACPDPMELFALLRAHVGVDASSRPEWIHVTDAARVRHVVRLADIKSIEITPT